MSCSYTVSIKVDCCGKNGLYNPENTNPRLEALVEKMIRNNIMTYKYEYGPDDKIPGICKEHCELEQRFTINRVNVPSTAKRKKHETLDAIILLLAIFVLASSYLYLTHAENRKFL